MVWQRVIHRNIDREPRLWCGVEPESALTQITSTRLHGDEEHRAKRYTSQVPTSAPDQASDR
jgi:hypothetical protein